MYQGVEYLALTSRKLREAADNLQTLEREEDEITQELGLDEEGDKINLWLREQPIADEHDIVMTMAKEFRMNLTDTKKMVENFPEKYTVEDKTISDMVKELRKFRRTLKGEEKDKLTKGIESLIDAYSIHLNDCIKSIYWLSDYEVPLKKMKFNETDLIKIFSIKDHTRRSKLVDILCKYWEANLEIKDCTYSKEYSTLSKQMVSSRKEFRKLLKSINHQSIRKNINDKLNDYIIEIVCDKPGISARQIHENMTVDMYRRASPQIISKSANRLNITNVDGKYFKITDDIRKDLYAYTAGFIDSDGYITMDKNSNPRVGLVATGDRGKAFMVEIQKSLGIGKLHLDQKSPQNTRPLNRLNFYSQGDIHELLTKCKPHLRMKGPQADLLLELIRIKKGYKKQDWYKGRTKEIFKLMKWNNHKDNVNYDWNKYEVDIENISKYESNSKMAVMDELELVGVVV